jgi:hypothetical protein
MTPKAVRVVFGLLNASAKLRLITGPQYMICPSIPPTEQAS